MYANSAPIAIPKSEILKLIDVMDSLSFLSAIHHNKDVTAQTFQIFDDNAERKDPALTRIINGPLTPQLHREITELNRLGAGIFFTVNRTDLKGRKRKNITTVRAVWGDFDNGLPDAWPLDPSLIVETSPGKFQVYWLLADRMTFEQHAAVQNVIVKTLGADARAKDLCHVFRWPGYLHRKGTPHLVTTVGGTRKRYSCADILAAFPSAAKTATKPKTQRTQDAPINLEMLQSALACVPSDDYHVWIAVVAAVKELLGEDGFEIADEWSRKSAKYAGTESVRAKWDSFSREEGDGPRASWQAIRKLARDHGWNSEAAFEFDCEDPFAWPIVNKCGVPKPTDARNVKAFCDRLGVRLSKNDFAGTYHVAGFAEGRLSDEIVDDLWTRAHKCGLNLNINDLHRMLCVIATEATFHPVRDYLASLKWDGTARLDRWLSKYCGADDTELNRAFGRLTLIAASRRVHQPGCKFDTMLVLEGAQGGGKSSAASILAGEWFTDCAQLGQDAKETIEQTRGKWIVEIAELAGKNRREIDAIKVQLSCTSDRARLAYGRTTSEVPRQFIFVGTTNDDKYLKDATGGRRFWPVRCGRINLEGLRRDRDQLWAEARHYDRAGVSLMLPERLWQVAAEVQEERREISAVEERLTALLADKCGFVFMEDLWHALGLPIARTKDRTQAIMNVLGAVLRRLGWERGRRRRCGRREYGYVRLNHDGTEGPLLTYDCDGALVASIENADGSRTLLN